MRMVSGRQYQSGYVSVKPWKGKKKKNSQLKNPRITRDVAILKAMLKMTDERLPRSLHSDSSQTNNQSYC